MKNFCGALVIIFIAAFQPVAANSSSITIKKEKPQALKFIKAYTRDTKLPSKYLEKEKALEFICKESEKIPVIGGGEIFIGLFVDKLIPRIINLFVKRADKKVQEAIEKYSAEYSAKLALKSGIPDGTRCFEFKAFSIKKIDGENKEILDMDFTGQIFVGNNNIQIRPIRLKYINTRAKNEDDNEKMISIVSISTTAIGKQGKKIKLFDQSLFEATLVGVNSDGSVSGEKKLLVHYFLKKNKNKNKNKNCKAPEDILFCPSQTWKATPIHGSLSSHGATMKVTVSETGTTPKTLKAVAKFLSDNETDISKKLIEVFQARLKAE